MKNKVLKPLEFLSFKEFEPVNTEPEEQDLEKIRWLLSWEFEQEYI